MIHSDLLDRIAQAGLEPHGNVMPTHLVLALRAVVKMHEPVSIPWDEYLEDICVPCDTDYPCPTIQAIEKELS